MNAGTKKPVWIGSYFLTACAVFVLLLFRQYGELSQVPIVWEDGTLFLSDAMCYSFWRNINTPFVGYLHLLPRCIAESACWLDLHYVPLYFRVTSVGIAALALSFPMTSLFRDVMPFFARLMLVLLTALVPLPTETLGNIASIHWYLFYFLMLLSLADTRGVSWGGVVLLLGACFLTVFSSPLCVLSVPVFAWRLFGRDKTGKQRLIDATVIGLTLFLLVLVKLVMDAEGTPDGVEKQSISMLSVVLFAVKATGYKVILLTLAGQRLCVRFLQHWAAIYTAVFAFGLACLAYCGFRTRKDNISNAGSSSKRSIPLIVLLYYLFAPIVFAAVLRPHYVTHFVTNDLYFGASRYFSLSVYVFILFSVELIRRMAVRFSRWRWLIILAPICWFSVIIPMNFVYPVTPDYGWSQKVSDYYEHPRDAEHIEGDRYLIVLPHDPPWNIYLPLLP